MEGLGLERGVRRRGKGGVCERECTREKERDREEREREGERERGRGSGERIRKFSLFIFFVV